MGQLNDLLHDLITGVGSNAPRATPKQIEALKARGFYVEDMGKEWGEGWQGQYRYLNRESEVLFQDYDTSDSEDDAWAACARDHRGE